MTDNKKTHTEFISYLDDNGKQIDGYFDVSDNNASYIEFLNKGNFVRIPWHRILKNKVKEDVEE